MSASGEGGSDEHALPRDIWDETLDEGERRLKRRLPGLAATGLVGGVDVMLGLAATTVVLGAMLSITDAEVAHLVGALAFGIALVFVTVGRSELFTENFLVPVGAVYAGRGNRRGLARMWSVTLVFNLIGLGLVAAILGVEGVLPESAERAAGELAKPFEERELGPAIGSAVLAGVVMTLFTWLSLAAKSDGARIALAMLVGFLLLAPSLNHAVVSFGEVALAIFSDASEIGAGELIYRESVAIVGNVAGGFGFVTVTRLVQVSGEPKSSQGG